MGPIRKPHAWMGRVHMHRIGGSSVGSACFIPSWAMMEVCWSCGLCPLVQEEPW